MPKSKNITQRFLEKVDKVYKSGKPSIPFPKDMHKASKDMWRIGHMKGVLDVVEIMAELIDELKLNNKNVSK